MTNSPPAGRLKIAGKNVSRLRLSTLHVGRGRHAWGTPVDRPAAVELVRTAVHGFGINLIDTPDAYGPHLVEELIREALVPYPEDLLIFTTVGMVRLTSDSWARCRRGRSRG
ncbi:aldo/keto reductase [Streptomyces sp. NPDC090493]|uniref:aldo/keto reductase n=1 Tax=Streptomyces sp. NPDC090493 TaxID=3365964 RepID=UPI003802D4E6